MILFYYLFYFTIFLILLPKYEHNIYISFWKHITFFIWYVVIGSSPLLYKFLGLIGYLTLLLTYPFAVRFFPKLRFSNYITLMYLNQPALEHSHDVVKKMYSKIYWYEVLRKENILTPKVIAYWNGDKLVMYDKPEKNVLYISKPNYGSNGNNVKLQTFDEFIKSLGNREEMILQEFVKDCYKDNRTVRILTKFINGKVYTSNSSNHFSEYVASNVLDKKTYVCKSQNCNFLSKEENDLISYICEKLKAVHEKKYYFVPYIGWDLILSCNGPYILEGNVGTAMYGVDRDEFNKEMIGIYKKFNYY
tara:strand:+ start:381 stop:1295 length:915 start_codon:yes stop_codon:yes gene_type:complete